MPKKINVLLVEDNPGDVFLMEDMLEDIPDYRFNISKTETLKDTVSMLRKTEFDIVLLDLGLPDSEGLSGLETILDMQVNLPVVVITGLNDGKTGRKAVEMGAQSYMVKGGFKSESIVQTILYSIDRNKIVNKLLEREAELKNTNKELTETNSAKNLLISVISHDLRGPLNSVISLLDVVNSEYDNIDDNTKKKYLKSILRSAKNTHGLMENLLQWAQIQSNRRKVEPEKLEAGKLIEEGTSPLEQMALEKEIELELNSSDNTQVYVDKRMISTVIRNLVSNALKFTPRNGKIRISSSSTKNGDMIISVADNGIGMEKEILEKVFELGKTTSTSGTENESGSGFGLIICKEFVEKNNGELRIESEKGKGTTVSFSLPLTSE